MVGIGALDETTGVRRTVKRSIALIGMPSSPFFYGMFRWEGHQSLSPEQLNILRDVRR
jgi:hypothetical protein